MRIAIVEDTRADQLQLLAYLKRYEQENNKKFQVSLFCDGDGITNPYTAEYDLILMDIEMAFLDGMTTAKEIRKSDSEVTLLFITNAPQYVMKGYEVDALDYLLKPVSYFSLAKRLDKVCKRLERKQRSFIKLNVKGGFQKVDVSHIKYVETDNRDLIYHTIDGDFRTRDTIQEAENTLDSLTFFRCHKCYLVNLGFVDGMVGSDVRIDGDIIQVSRAKKKAFLDAMNRYMSETNI